MWERRKLSTKSNGECSGRISMRHCFILPLSAFQSFCLLFEILFFLFSLSLSPFPLLSFAFSFYLWPFSRRQISVCLAKTEIWISTRRRFCIWIFLISFFSLFIPFILKSIVKRENKTPNRKVAKHAYFLRYFVYLLLQFLFAYVLIYAITCDTSQYEYV